MRFLSEDTSPPGIPDIRAREQIAKRSIWVSVVVNIVLTLGQVVTGLFAGSQSLVADGIHTLSDVVADFIVLIALAFGGKEPDSDHPYGHQRYENAGSLILGVILIVVGLGMVWAAVVKLQTPHAIATVHIVALWAALFTLAVKEGLFRYMLAVAKRARSDLLVANAWHARSDAASSLIVALGVGGNLLGFGLLDPIAALIVGCLIAKVGWRFSWEAFNDLADRAASHQDIASIAAAVLATPGVRGMHDLRTRRMGSMIIADVHLEIEGRLSVTEGHAIALEARQRVLEQCPDVLNLMTHVDPV